MLRRNFISRLFDPYQALVVQCARNDLVHEAQNDVVAATQALATSAAHFLEANRQSTDSGSVKALQQKLQDVADTAKHGSLRKANRVAEITIAYSYEFNEQQQFRFIRREIFATNQRFGEFQLVDTIGEYLAVLMVRFGFDLGPINPSIAHQPFMQEARIIVTPKTFDVGQIHLRFFKRSETGTLLLADPPECRIVWG